MNLNDDQLVMAGFICIGVLFFVVAVGSLLLNRIMND
jgi:hypothetical protein